MNMNENIIKVNAWIAEMLQGNKEETSYDWNHKCIRGSFCCSGNYCNYEITKEDIYRQLALIDTLYSTNVNRMRKFGLEEITEVIWDLCKDTNSDTHTLGILSKKLIATQPLNQEVKNAFSLSYGYIKGDPAEEYIKKVLSSASIEVTSDINAIIQGAISLTCYLMPHYEEKEA